MNAKENWKFVDGHPDYLISDQGRVLSLKREPIVMIPSTNHQGYRRIMLDGKWCQVHRLVAKAFVSGWFEGAVVNHLDENPGNNNADNLEWCTYSRNNSYGRGHENRKITKGAAVRCYTLEGEFLAEFPSISEAARVIGCANSGISDCLRKRGNHKFNGLLWEKVKEANTHA